MAAAAVSGNSCATRAATAAARAESDPPAVAVGDESPLEWSAAREAPVSDSDSDSGSRCH